MNELLEKVICIAKQAGDQILAIYRSDTNFFSAAQQSNLLFKQDGSPSTAADWASETLLTQALKQLTPDCPIVSEEDVPPFQERRRWSRYWLIDPLDGTKEFLDKNDEFTINIALIEYHYPVLGVIFAPVFDLFYCAIEKQQAFKRQGQNSEKIQTRSLQREKIRVVSSRRHGLDALRPFLQQYPDYSVCYKGSALKFGFVAEGQADLYLRLGPTSEWDTAAGQCIVETAGGAVVDLAGKRLAYNQKDSLVNPDFLAAGDVTQSWKQHLSQYT